MFRMSCVVIGALSLGPLLVSCSADIRLGGVTPNAADGAAGLDGASDGGTLSNDGGSSAPDAHVDGSTCIADLTLDPRSCGACGHDCLGGACLLGQCQPFQIAQNLHGPFWLTLDATTVYWTELGDPTTNSVRQCRKDGSGLITLATAPGTFGGIVVDGKNAYWSHQTQGPIQISVERTPLAPAAPSVTEVTNLLGAFYAGGVAVDATTVYFTTNSLVAGAPKNGTMVSAQTVLSPVDGTGPVPLATDGSTLFLASQSGLYTGTATLSLPALVPVKASSIGASDIAINGTRVFGAGDSTVWSLPIAGGPTSTFTTQELGAGGVAVDTTTVYFTTATEVRATPIAGGGPIKVLARGYTQLGHIAADGTAVYFTDFNGGSIWKLAK